MEYEYVELVVRLTMRSTADGGRRRPISAGYLAAWDNGDRLADGSVHYHDAMIKSLPVESLAPGGSADVVIRTALPEQWRHVRPFDRLRMCEGSRAVGDAIVISGTEPFAAREGGRPRPSAM